jgi:putative Holliday junction resolvase
MGFDFGKVRIGVAIGQELTATATPLTEVSVKHHRPNWQIIDELMQQWQPDLLVLGLPYHADGSSNTVTEAAITFGHELQHRYGLKIETIDEHLSSREAKQRIAQTLATTNRKSRHKHRIDSVDSVAAALILESWFNQQRTGFPKRTSCC